MSVDFKKICNDICPIIKKFPKKLDGKKSILEMKENNGSNWKQMEWMGFYFEYWCNKNLKKIMQMPYAKKYGRVSFDGFLEIPWDFKCHAIESGNKVIINDSEAISNAVNEFGCIGVILVAASVNYDNESLDFKKWHDVLKGGTSNYEKKRLERRAPSRKRKTSMNISKIYFIRIDDDLLVRCGSFQKNFRNANGVPRRGKVLLDLTKMNEHVEYMINYNDLN